MSRTRRPIDVAALAHPVLRQIVALCAIVAVVGIAIGLAGGLRDVQAATGSSAGRVFGTGSIAFGGGTHTVTLDLATDLSAAPTGTFSISDGVNPTSDGTATCLSITGMTATIGVYLSGPALYGSSSITDNVPGTDTLWLDTPVTTGPVDCTTSPSPGELLSSGDFTVTSDPGPPGTPEPSVVPSDEPTIPPTAEPSSEPTVPPTPEPVSSRPSLQRPPMLTATGSSTPCSLRGPPQAPFWTQR